jgi:hypothetical protein
MARRHKKRRPVPSIFSKLETDRLRELIEKAGKRSKPPRLKGIK